MFNSRPFRFLIVGGATFIIYFTLQYVLERIRFNPYVALSLAYAIAIAFHYLMNRSYTFENKLVLSNVSASLVKYAAVNVLNYFITLGVVSIIRSFGFNIKIGMMAAIVFTTGTGYLMYRHWVFRI